MKQNIPITHEFVELIPKKMEELTIYVSIEFTTASHKCFCGCGMEVVTPISPADWQLIFDGETITLHPSVGNWGFKCQSHYIIRRNTVVWAGPMSKEEIARVRLNDHTLRSLYYKSDKEMPNEAISTPPPLKKRGFWETLKFWRQ